MAVEELPVPILPCRPLPLPGTGAFPHSLHTAHAAQCRRLIRREASGISAQTGRILIGACALLLVPVACALADPRERISVNSDWSFQLEDPARRNAGGEIGEAWQAVDLPHTWNAADSRNKSRPYHRGTATYRKSLFVAPSLAGKTLYLRFEGVNQIADVSINGEPAGRHVGGYSAFTFDIGGLVRFGERNDIEVRVDNRHNADIPPLNADFTFYGGIYRDVWLLVLDDVHFALDDYAATEFSIRPLSVSESRATVEVDVGLSNRSERDRKVRVHTSIENAEGTVITGESTEITIGAGGVSRQTARFEITEPALWSPESPYLYRVIGTISEGPAEGSTILDRVQYPLGLRWFEFDAATGFRLNGKPYRLFGTNRHQDYAGIGNALPDDLHRTDLQKIKDNGFNFLRLAHYPQDPAVLSAADELGLLVWEETPLVNLIGLSDAFRQNSTRMVREMVRQHRHHPSVTFWGYMNEVTLVDPDPLPAGYHDAVVALAKHLNAVVREEDPSRPTVMALSRDELGKAPALQTVPDILAFNLYFGWYYEELDTLGPFLDAYRRNHPDVPLFVSEYGAGSDERLHSCEPAAFDFSTEYQQRFHEASFRQILDRPWLIGSAVWAQFDFGSDYRQDTKYGLNQKGLWYYDRTPKDIAAWYRARLSSDPVLYIAARDWPRRAGSREADATMPVRIFSNEPAAELFVNGRSLGTREVRDAAAVWDVRFAPGENILSARSSHGNDEVAVFYEDRVALFDGGAAPAVTLAVNAGGNEQFIGGDGRVWEADRAYERGSWGYTGGERERSHRRILEADDDPLYQTRRSGPHAYRFDVADGTYLVELHLAGLDEAANGAGSFNVEANGLVADMSPAPPFTRRQVDLLVAASGGRGVTLEFGSGAGDAYVNGIALRRFR